eukprot:3748388-Prymnesium_polylepis.1
MEAAEAQLAKALRGVTHPRDLLWSGKTKSSGTTLDFVWAKLKPQLHERARTLISKRTREHNSSVDANEKIVQMAVATLLIVLLLWWITAIDAWVPLLTCVAVVVLVGNGVLLFIFAVDFSSGPSPTSLGS